MSTTNGPSPQFQAEPSAARISLWQKVVARVRRRPAIAALLATVLLVTVAGLAGISWAYSDAVAVRQEAETARQSLTADLYFQQIALAHSELAQKNLGRVEQILDDCPADLRNWEWTYLHNRLSDEPRTLAGHNGWVSSVAFSPDGKLLASGSLGLWRLVAQFGEVKVWDVTTSTEGRQAGGKEVHTFLGHNGAVTRVAFSPNGNRLASAGLDGTVRLWDVVTGKSVRVLAAHKGGVSGLAFSPEGKRLATAGRDKTLQLWDVAEGKVYFTWTGHTEAVTSVTFSPDGQRLLSTSDDTTVRLWDANTGFELHSLPGHPGGSVCGAFAPDGRFATGGLDGSVKLWSAEGDLVTQFRGHRFSVLDLVFSGDGRRLVSAGWDQTVKVWDTASGHEALRLTGHGDRVNGVALSRDGLLASAGGDGTVRLWNGGPSAENGRRQPLTLQDGLSDPVSALAYRPGGEQLASGSLDGSVRLWEVTPVVSVRPDPLPVHEVVVSALAYHPNGRYLASASWDRTIKIWDVVEGKEIRTLQGHRRPIWSLAYSPDGSRLASASADGTVRVWDAATGETLTTLEKGLPAIQAVAFGADGQRLALGSVEGGILLWDLAAGKEVQRLRGHEQTVAVVAFSPTVPHLLLSASWDQTARVWDLTKGKEMARFTGHGQRVLAAAWHPAGKWVASGDSDGRLFVWEAATGKIVGRPRSHPGAVQAVAFSPDGQQLAVGAGVTGKGMIRIWDRTAFEK
jgi:WD40 repeat protein